MRSKYDMIEDMRIAKSNKVFNRKVVVTFIAVMLFLIGCVMFFYTTYLYAIQQIEIHQKEEDELVQSNQNATRKTYYIEQRIRKDLEKMLQQRK
jgi:ascorbate-specific PTS system EIIC-type component UlaA